MNTRLHYAKDEGIEQGSREKQIEIAKTMLEENYTVEQISKITKLTEEEIKESLK